MTCFKINSPFSPTGSLPVPTPSVFRLCQSPSRFLSATLVHPPAIGWSHVRVPQEPTLSMSTVSLSCVPTHLPSSCTSFTHGNTANQHPPLDSKVPKLNPKFYEFLLFPRYLLFLHIATAPFCFSTPHAICYHGPLTGVPAFTFFFLQGILGPVAKVSSLYTHSNPTHKVLHSLPLDLPLVLSSRGSCAPDCWQISKWTASWTSVPYYMLLLPSSSYSPSFMSFRYTVNASCL